MKNLIGVMVHDLSPEVPEKKFWTLNALKTATPDLISKTELSAAKSCLKFKETITMGSVIAEPIWT